MFGYQPLEPGDLIGVTQFDASPLGKRQAPIGVVRVDHVCVIAFAQSLGRIHAHRLEEAIAHATLLFVEAHQ